MGYYLYMCTFCLDFESNQSIFWSIAWLSKTKQNKYKSKLTILYAANTPNRWQNEYKVCNPNNKHGFVYIYAYLNRSKCMLNTYVIYNHQQYHESSQSNNIPSALFESSIFVYITLFQWQCNITIYTIFSLNKTQKSFDISFKTIL